jgi:hypothetical protein
MVQPVVQAKNPHPFQPHKCLIKKKKMHLSTRKLALYYYY